MVDAREAVAWDVAQRARTHYPWTDVGPSGRVMPWARAAGSQDGGLRVMDSGQRNATYGQCERPMAGSRMSRACSTA